MIPTIYCLQQQMTTQVMNPKKAMDSYLLPCRAHVSSFKSNSHLPEINLTHTKAKYFDFKVKEFCSAIRAELYLLASRSIHKNLAHVWVAPTWYVWLQFHSAAPLTPKDLLKPTKELMYEALLARFPEKAYSSLVLQEYAKEATQQAAQRLH